MNPIPINLAVEDELSKAVATKLLQHAGPQFKIGKAFSRGGYGYLKKTILGWNNAAQGVPFLVLTDLDDCVCPAKLIDDWLPHGKNPNLLVRVAVREVESWLLADATNLAEFLKIAAQKMPPEPDTLPDPKALLIQLATSSKSREIRDRLVPKPRSTANQGREYNPCLVEFVRQSWSIRESAKSSPSLARTISRLKQFTPVWNR